MDAVERQTSPALPSLDDCWNRTGVRGDRTCPELAGYAHCWNCPVHAAAAVRLLDRPLSPDSLDEATRQVSAPAPQVRPGTRSALVFRLGSEWLGLATSTFSEVAEPGPFHSLPHRKGTGVLGLVNLRGELLVLVDLAFLLGVSGAGLAPQGPVHGGGARLLVLSHPSGKLVVPVEEVAGVQRYHPGDLREAPATVSRAERTYVTGILDWNERTVGLLDPELLLYTLTRSLA